MCVLLSSIAADIALGSFQPSHVLRHQDDSRALPTEGTRDLTSNPLTGAGDERGLSLQSQLHRPPPSTLIPGSSGAGDWPSQYRHAQTPSQVRQVVRPVHRTLTPVSARSDASP